MSKENYPLVVIVILNWNNAQDTLECLNSLTSVTYPNYKIIVVDNNSKDDSLKKINDFIRATDKLEIDILKNSENLGFAGGSNSGIEESYKYNPDYILLLNNDTVVDKEFLSSLVVEAEKDTKNGIVAPVMYFMDKPDLVWFGGDSKIEWKKMEHLIVNDLENKELPKNYNTQKVRFITGACMLIRKEVFKDIKGFNDKYFLYFEDADFSFRAINSGWNLVWTPNAKIWHKVSSTALSNSGAPLMNYYNVRNVMLLAREHAPIWVRSFYMHVWALFKISKQVIKLAFGHNRELSIMIIKGISDYYFKNFGKY